MGHFVEQLLGEVGLAGLAVAVEDDVKGDEVGVEVVAEEGVVERDGGVEAVGFGEGGEDWVEEGGRRRGQGGGEGGEEGGDGGGGVVGAEVGEDEGGDQWRKRRGGGVQEASFDSS